MELKPDDYSLDDDIYENLWPWMVENGCSPVIVSTLRVLAKTIRVDLCNNHIDDEHIPQAILTILDNNEIDWDEANPLLESLLREEIQCNGIPDWPGLSVWIKKVVIVPDEAMKLIEGQSITPHRHTGVDWSSEVVLFPMKLVLIQYGGDWYFQGHQENEGQLTLYPASCINIDD